MKSFLFPVRLCSLFPLCLLVVSNSNMVYEKILFVIQVILTRHGSKVQWIYDMESLFGVYGGVMFVQNK